VTIAYYARKSNDRKNESVENQFSIIDSYTRRQKDLKNASIVRFFDDGETGMNTEREDFENLLTKVRSREIDVLAVKDLSRLGRNYLDVIRLVESIFPFMGVRVIAVSDNYDSLRRNPSEPLNLPVAIKAVLNEFYVAENAEKVKKSLHYRIRNGKIYGELSYGYVYGEDRKPRIDPEKAAVIREIFQLCLDGWTNVDIAKKLNSRGVFMLRGSKWTQQQVHRVLTNENYTGVRNSLKSFRDLKTKKWIYRKPSEIFTNENALPPIVSAGIFQKVQKLFPKKTREQNPENHIMARKLFCGHCGKTLGRPRNFYCRSPNTTGEKRCFEGGLKPETLYPAVVGKVQAKVRAEFPDLPPRFTVQTGAKLQEELDLLFEKRGGVFTLFLENEISENEFVKRKTALNRKIGALKNELSLQRTSAAFYTRTLGGDRPVDALSRLLSGDVLTREHMKFVKRIDVFSTENFEITLFDESVINVLNRNISIYEEI
jgi:DNA invertase Pin-like site-specific DNA recombinase